MAYASPMKIANGLVLDFTVDNADTANDTFLGLNSSGEVTKFASVPRARVSGGGNITEATSSVLSITGGTAAVLTSGLTIQVLQAGAAQSGYLSTTDWNTFNNKLSPSLTSAYIYVGNGSNVATGVAMSGDISITNTGNTQIVAGAIVNADINASAAIAVSKLEALTASRVLGSNGSGVIQALDTATYPSLTELSYVKGVASAIQTQLNNRLSVTLSSPANGDVITYNGAAWVNSPSSTGVPTGGTTAQILRKIDNTNYNTEWHTLLAADLTDVSSTAAELNKLSGVTTTATQFNFLNTLSGDVQAQLAAKVGTSLTQNYMFVGDASNVVSTLAPGTNGYVLTSVSGAPTWVSPGVGGTVTSVAASGGTTGMSFTGSPITTSGTLTLTGTLAIANGGTGAALADPGADRIMFWDDSAGAVTWLTAGTGLSISTTTLGISLTNGNGTTANGSAVDLGGTLTKNTVINGSGSNFNLSLGDASLGELGNFTVVTSGATTISSTASSTSSLSVGGSTGYLRNGARGFEVSPTGFYVFANAGQYLQGDATGFIWGLGSDATGDTYQRDASGYFSRLAAVSAGSFLRSGGVATVNAWSTVKLPDTMSALGLWVANSANTTVNLTATAGQSIRVNAGGTAWEAYTPGGSGIGGSTGATDNSILRADGTGGATLQNSELFIDDSANVLLGTSGLAGASRSISVVGSASNISLDLVPKGTNGVIVGSRYLQMGRTSDGDTFRTLSCEGSEAQIVFDIYSKGTGAWIDINGHFQVYDISSAQRATIQNNNYAGLSFDEGNSFFSISSYPTTATTADFKLLVLGDGATPTGNLYLDAPTTGGGAGNIVLASSSIADFQDMQQGVVISNRTAAPTAGITNSMALFAEDVGSSSELYTYSESGAKFNVSGLVESVLLSGTTLTLSETHRGKVIYCTSGSAVTITVPASLQLGYNTVIMQDGTGTVSLTTSGGAVVNGKTATTGQYDTIGLVLYKATDTYLGR